MKTYNLTSFFAIAFAAVIIFGLHSCRKDETISSSTISPTTVSSTSVSSTIIASPYHVSNGDTIELTTIVKGEIDGHPALFTVDYSCDEQLIGTSKDSTNNYLLKYLVDGLAVGKHTIKSKSTYSDKNHNLSSVSSTNLFVIE